MKLLYVQIFAAAMATTTVGAGVGVMSAVAAKKETERKLEKAESELKKGRGAAPITAPKTPGEADAEKEKRELAGRVRDLETRLKALEAENKALKDKLALGAGAAPGKPVPGGSLGTAAPPNAVVVEDRGRDLAPPPPPEPQNDGNNPWGAAEDSQLDEMAAVIKLNPEQREAVKTIILEGQNEFERLLIEASQKGERDITIIEKIGEQVSKKTQSRIEQLLYPEQKPKFAEYMRRQEEGK
jgi:hypothetical protein